MAFVVVGIVVAGLLALWVMAWAIMPRCPWCGSKRTEHQGEWDGLAFHKCRACGSSFEVWYRSKP